MIINLILIYMILMVFVQYISKQRPNVLSCGMVAFSGEDDFDPSLIKMLMLSNMIRGVHSTGTFNNGIITKSATNAIEFLKDEKLIPEKMFMGHDRHATVGNKLDFNNAHPFRRGNLVGQHNGTLTNHFELARELELEYNDWDVDSQVILEGIDRDRKDLKILYEFEGAAALIWTYLDKPGVLYCFRNDKRPLYRGKIDKNMYISSIKESLEMIGCTAVKEFKTDYVYAIKEGKILRHECKRIVNKPVHIPNKNHIQGNMFNHRKASTTKDDGLKGVDTKSKWVKRTAHSDRNGDFIKGRWYPVSSSYNGDKFWVRSESGVNTVVAKILFSPEEDLTIGAHVIVPKGSGDIFKTGEVLYLRGLALDENDSERTIAHLEKLHTSDKTFTWSSSFIRNVEEGEAAAWIKNNMDSKDSGIEDESPVDNALSSQEELYHQFENSSYYTDEDGNRLGNVWIEIGDLYDSLMEIKISLSDTQDAIFDVIAEASSYDRGMAFKLGIIGDSIEDIEGDVEDNISSVFDKAYDISENIEKEEEEEDGVR